MGWRERIAKALVDAEIAASLCHTQRTLYRRILEEWKGKPPELENLSG
jgi:hypothetical protein